MERKKAIKWVTRVGLIGVLALVAACSGVSQQDYDAVKKQVADKDKEVAALKQQVDSAKAAAGQQVASIQQELADLKKTAGAAPAKNPYVWTQIMPTPMPANTPTPRPPGFVAPTPVPPDPTTVNAVFPFTFYVETLTGHQVSEVQQFPSCVLTSQFRRGTHLVWRFEVFDTSTAKRLTSLDTPTVKLVLPTGEELTARFARKGGTGPWTWVAAWDVPKNYPFGPLDYRITVKSKDGRSGAFDPNLVALVNKDRGIDQRVLIVE